jgi:prepilin-type N-terminal cleavage/methylation domain-containing protein
MRLSSQARGFTLVELMVTSTLIGVVGLVLYSLLNISMILGAKNTAINTAHQQARVAMIDMLQDIHSAVSLPALSDSSGTPYSSAPSNAAGISFQEWSSGPHKIINDTAIGATQITIALTSSSGPAPVAGERLIIPAYQIEADIASIANSSPGNFKVNLTNISGPSLSPPVTYPTNSLPVAIKGTDSNAGDIVCFVTDRCSYAVSNSSLVWKWKGNTRTAATDITNITPFSTPTTPAGALYYRFVAAIDLSTADSKYSNRGYKSANILLNGQVPFKVRLTVYQ